MAISRVLEYIANREKFIQFFPSLLQKFAEVKQHGRQTEFMKTILPVMKTVNSKTQQEIAKVFTEKVSSLHLKFEAIKNFLQFFEKDVKIFEQGDVCEYAYILLEGECKMQLGGGGLHGRQ